MTTTCPSSRFARKRLTADAIAYVPARSAVKEIRRVRMGEFYPGKSVRMKSSYRNVAIAAGGVLAAAVAARIIRSYTSGKRQMTAQTMTVSLDRETAIDRLTDDIIQTSVGCDQLMIVRDLADNRLIEWSCGPHPEESGRLALIAAPERRGTELHAAMHGEKYHVKEIVRRMKMLLETGEIATGARQ